MHYICGRRSNRKTWFLIIFCHFWQFWLPNTWGYGRKDFKFSKALHLICIHTMCKNKKIEQFLGRSTPPKKQYFFQKFNFGIFFGIYLLPYNWCKWNQATMKLSEILRLIMFHVIITKNEDIEEIWRRWHIFYKYLGIFLSQF